jgi:hypothetical protein
MGHRQGADGYSIRIPLQLFATGRFRAIRSGTWVLGGFHDGSELNV